jgi:hypothetical protein
MGIVTSPEVASLDMTSPEVMNRKWKGDNFPRFSPAFSPRVSPGTPLDSRYEQWNCESNLYRVTIDLLPHLPSRMMNNILFTKKPNKQKNIENAVIYCIHIPLSQLITADCTIQEGKWGSRSIVTRYRLDSQFHCSYLESRGVPGETRGKTAGENAGNYLPFISGSRLPVTSYPVMQLPVTSRSPSIPLKCGLSCPYILLT